MFCPFVCRYTIIKLHVFQPTWSYKNEEKVLILKKQNFFRTLLKDQDIVFLLVTALIESYKKRLKSAWIQY